MKNKKLKVLVIGTTDFIGGAAGVGWALGSELAKKGLNIKYVVGYKKSKSKDVYELKKSKVISFFESKTRFNLNSLIRFFRAFIFADDIDFGASREILDHPWYKEADIVQCHNLHGNYFKLETLAKIANEKPVVWTLHDGWALTAHCANCYDCKNYNNGKHFTAGINRYGAMLWNNSDYLWNKKKNIYKNSPKLTIVTPSEWLADRVKTGILKEKPLKVINNGIDTNIFKPRDTQLIRKELKLPANKIIIVYIAQMGTLDPRKGGSYFLDVANHFSENKDIVFLCIGGIIGNKMTRKNNIVYVPFISNREEIAKYYSASDILLFTSLAENFPLVTLEALSTGLPIVSFDVGGVKEQIINRKNGYIAKYKNTEDLIKGVKYVLGLNKNKFELIQRRNRERAVAKYSVKRMGDEYLKLYKTII